MTTIIPAFPDVEYLGDKYEVDKPLSVEDDVARRALDDGFARLDTSKKKEQAA